MSEIDYAARVAKGAALLDEKRPGWERLINLDILDIENGSCCVTAQLSGMQNGPQSWCDGMQALDLTGGLHGSYVAHGFNAPHEDEFEDIPEGYAQDDAYATLNALWKSLITTRLAAEPADG